MHEVYEIINKILFDDWDPIGINFNLNLYDEYVSYVPQLVKMLGNNDDEEEIAQYLCKITKVDMGLSSSDMSIHLDVARKLKVCFEK